MSFHRKISKMKIVQVTYTTTSEYSAHNQRNIEAVMAALKHDGISGINYNACLSADSKTFVHTAYFETEEAQLALNALPIFQEFQAQLKASEPEAPPRQVLLTLVGTSKPIF